MSRNESVDSEEFASVSEFSSESEAHSIPTRNNVSTFNLFEIGLKVKTTTRKFLSGAARGGYSLTLSGSDRVTGERVLSLEAFRCLRVLAFTELATIFLSFVVPLEVFAITGNGFAIGIVVSARYGGQALGSFAAGRLTDYGGQHRPYVTLMMVLGCIFHGLSFLLLYVGLAIMRSFLLTVVGMSIYGFSRMFIGTPLRTIIMDDTPRKKRGEAFGLYHRWSGLGIAVGCIVALSILGIAESMDLGVKVETCSFLVFSFMNFIAAGCFLRDVPVLQQHSKQLSAPTVQGSTYSVRTPELTVCDLLGKWSFRFLRAAILLLICFDAVSLGIVRPYVPVFLEEKTGKDSFFLALAYLPGGVLSMLVAPLLGRFTDGFRPRNSMVVTLLLGATTILLLLISNELWQAATIILVDFIVQMILIISTHNLMASLSRSKRGRTLGYTKTAESVGRLLGPLAGAVLFEEGSSESPFWISAFIRIALAFLFFTLLHFAPVDLDLKSMSKKSHVLNLRDVSSISGANTPLGNNNAVKRTEADSLSPPIRSDTSRSATTSRKMSL